MLNKLIYFALRGFIFFALVADVAELADALDSKSGTLTSVWVRPPPSAPLSFSSISKISSATSAVFALDASCLGQADQRKTFGVPLKDRMSKKPTILCED